MLLILVDVLGETKMMGVGGGRGGGLFDISYYNIFFNFSTYLLFAFFMISNTDKQIL